MVRRGRNNRSRGTVRRGAVTKAQLRHQFRGHVLYPRGDPSRVVRSPWYNLMVAGRARILASGTGALLTIKEIQSSTIKQLGFQGLSSKLEFRLSSIRVWGLTPSSSIQLVAYDLQSSGDLSGIQAEVTDEPAHNQWPRVGFQWSAADANVVFPGDLDYAVALIRSVSDIDVALRIEVNWRSAVAAPPDLHRMRVTSSIPD